MQRKFFGFLNKNLQSFAGVANWHYNVCSASRGRCCVKPTFELQYIVHVGQMTDENIENNKCGIHFSVILTVYNATYCTYSVRKDLDEEIKQHPFFFFHFVK